MREVVIASSVRTPVGRAFKGTLRATRPDETAAVAIKGALERIPQLDAKEIAEVIVAGGTESMSMIPMGGHKISPNPWLVSNYPDAYLSMGLSAERLAQRFGITREESDDFSLRSHQKAVAAIQAGKFDEECVSVPVSFTTPNGSKPKRQEIVFKADEGPRADTSL